MKSLYLFVLSAVVASLCASCLVNEADRDNPLDPASENFIGYEIPIVSAPPQGMSYTVYWTDVGAANYRIEESLTTDFSNPVSHTVGGCSYRFTHGNLGLNYYYRVSTVTGNKKITWSNSVAVKAMASPWETMGNEYAALPKGSVAMGSNMGAADEKPVHTVTLSPFEIGRFEITQGQYVAVMGINPSSVKGDDSLPVEQVSWPDAAAFCNALSRQAGLTECYDETTGTCDYTKNGFRLPTEAEWEYACRAGTSTLYNTGDGESDLDRAGWHYGNSGMTIHPAGSKASNTWGLFDMHGNLWEWCSDWYGGYSSGGTTDPTGAAAGEKRVIRGGSAYNGSCYSTDRNSNLPSTGGHDIGFRIVRRP